MKNIIIAIVAVAVIGGLGYIFFEPGVEEAVTPTENNGSQAKINIDVVCEEALAYKSFTDGASADAFVAECKAGNHPEVIEEYKQRMNLGDGAAI